MSEYRLEFSWTLTVEAESKEEAKQVAPNVLFDHLRQVRLKESDFEVLEGE